MYIKIFHWMYDRMVTQTSFTWSFLKKFMIVELHMLCLCIFAKYVHAYVEVPLWLRMHIHKQVHVRVHKHTNLHLHEWWSRYFWTGSLDHADCQYGDTALRRLINTVITMFRLKTISKSALSFIATLRGTARDYPLKSPLITTLVS